MPAFRCGTGGGGTDCTRGEQTGPAPPAPVNKVSLEHDHALYSHTVFGGFHAAMAEQSHWNRSHGLHGLKHFPPGGGISGRPTETGVAGSPTSPDSKRGGGAWAPLFSDRPRGRPVRIML